MKRTFAVAVVALAVMAGGASGWALTGRSSAASTPGQWSIVSAQSVISPLTFGGQAGARQNKNPADAIARSQGASPADPAVDSVRTTVAGGNVTIRLHVKHLDQGTNFSGGGRYMSVWLNLLTGSNEQAGILSLTNNPSDTWANKPIFTCGEVKPALFPESVVAGGFDYTTDTITFSVPESLLATSCRIVNKRVTLDGDVMLYDWWNKSTAPGPAHIELFDSGVWKSHIHGPVLRAPTAASALSGSMQAHTGRLSGNFIAVGGISGVAPSPQAGTVTLTNVATGVRETVESGSDGRFSINLSPGAYLASGVTPQFVINNVQAECRAATPVVVQEGQVSSVTVTCDRK